LFTYRYLNASNVVRIRLRLRRAHRELAPFDCDPLAVAAATAATFRASALRTATFLSATTLLAAATLLAATTTAAALTAT
jgi:hypothetical protein